MKTYNEEQEEKNLWEVWLHRAFDKSYKEFRELVKQEEIAAPTQEEIQETVQNSYEILAGFDMCGGADGDIQTAGDNSG